MKIFIVIIVSLFCGWNLNSFYWKFVASDVLAQYQNDVESMCRDVLNISSE